MIEPATFAAIQPMVSSLIKSMLANNRVFAFARLVDSPGGSVNINDGVYNVPRSITDVIVSELEVTTVC